MTILTKNLNIKTRGDCDIMDITRQVSGEIAESSVNSGIVTVFITGSTAGVTTIEYEPGLVNDLTSAFNRLIPANINYAHDMRWGDGNGHAHVRASILGCSLVVPFNNKKLELGTWQQIVIVDFDNRPRTRNILLQIIGE